VCHKANEVSVETNPFQLATGTRKRQGRISVLRDPERILHLKKFQKGGSTMPRDYKMYIDGEWVGALRNEFHR
jgi:hypothetical protein